MNGKEKVAEQLVFALFNSLPVYLLCRVFCPRGCAELGYAVIQSMWCCFSENELNPTEDEELLTWESLMKDRYLVSARQEQSQSTERRILDTVQK